MKKVLLIGLLFGIVSANEAPRNPERFNEVKQKINIIVDKEIQTLNQFKNCVNKSQSKQEMKSCRQERKSKMQELKAEAKEARGKMKRGGAQE